jgi:hypothetical protein
VLDETRDDFNLTAFTHQATDEAGLTNEIITHSRSQYAAKVDLHGPRNDRDDEAEGGADEQNPPPPPPTSPAPVSEAVIIPAKEKDLPVSPKAPSKHRYHQTLIKKTAEAHGYKASIEVAIPNGSVDVLLEKDGETIAVEVSETTDAQWELHNIEKCLTRNYTTIFSCIDNAKTRHEVTKLVQAMKPIPTNVSVDTVENLLTFLQETSKKSENEIRVKGYKVKVQHRTLTTEEGNTKRAIIESIVNSGKK